MTCHAKKELQGIPVDASAGVGGRVSLVFLQLRQLHCLWLPFSLPHGLHPTVLLSLNSSPSILTSFALF